MTDADRKGTVKQALRKFGLPTAAGIIGTGAGLILTRKPNSGRAVPDMKGVGNLVDDLRGKLDAVIGKSDDGDKTRSSATSRTRQLSTKQLTQRRRAREQRRNKRRSRAGR